MARIFVTCPETEMPVYTGIAMDERSFESSALQDKNVKYPHCGRFTCGRKTRTPWAAR